jgi:hypothetical protein
VGSLVGTAGSNPTAPTRPHPKGMRGPRRGPAASGRKHYDTVGARERPRSITRLGRKTPAARGHSASTDAAGARAQNRSARGRGRGSPSQRQHRELLEHVVRVLVSRELLGRAAAVVPYRRVGAGVQQRRDEVARVEQAGDVAAGAGGRGSGAGGVGPAAGPCAIKFVSNAARPAALRQPGKQPATPTPSRAPRRAAPLTAACGRLRPARRRPRRRPAAAPSSAPACGRWQRAAP